ncbi:MAG TPA: metalloregulator ArsR/SmtB family transcription factor [Opitutaceae bacterium]
MKSSSAKSTSLLPPVARATLTPETVELIAQRFRALGEPMRLRLLMALQGGERIVGELVDELETSQANISKHLQVLSSAGLLRRRKQGLNVFYSVADPSIFNMCEMVCGSLKKHLDAQSRLLT